MPDAASPTAEDFLLPEADAGDSLAFRPPARSGSRVEPLVDGAAALEAMELALLEAREYVHLASPLFDPLTPTRSKAAKREAGTWGDLILRIALGTHVKPKRPVAVRILLGDVDPILGNDFHRSTWLAYRRLLAGVGEHVRGSARDGFAVMVALPGGDTSFASIPVADERLRAAVRQLNDLVAFFDVASARERFLSMPGLWEIVRFDEATSTFSFAPDAAPTLRPTSREERLCVVDRRVAFCGAVAPVAGRADTPDHTRGGGSHDLHCRVTGELVADADRAFRARWNAERERFEAFVDAANAAQPAFALQRLPVGPLDAAPPAAAPVKDGISAQVLCTLADAPGRRDVEEAWEKAIGRAERFVYLESEHLHSPRVADWLVARKGQAAELKAIVVLPAARDGDRLSRHGIARQREALTRLAQAFGADLGAYSLARRDRARTPIELHGASLIVDDAFASVGSADATERGLRHDGELGVAWVDPPSVSAFRRRLWKDLLGLPEQAVAAWAPADIVKEWNAVADRPPESRTGLVVRYDTSAAGALDPAVLEEHAELPATDPKAVADYLPPLREAAAAATAAPAGSRLLPGEAELVEAALPLADDYDEVAEVLFVARRRRRPRVEGGEVDPEDKRALEGLRTLIQPHVDAHEAKLADEFRGLSDIALATLGRKTGREVALQNFRMVRPLYCRAGYANPAADIFGKIKSPKEGAKLLELDIDGGAHEKLVAKLADVRAILDGWGVADLVQKELKVVGGFVPVFQQPDGSWVPRYVMGQSAPILSNHALGLAIDIDAVWNPQIPAKSETIALLKEITSEVAREDPGRGLPSEGFDLGQTLIDPSIAAWPEVGKAVSVWLLSMKASQAIIDWLTDALADEKALSEAVEQASAAVKAAQDAKAAAVAAKNKPAIEAAEATLKAAKEEHKQAKARLEGDPAVQRVRRLRKLQGGGNAGKKTVESWASKGIISLPLALVAAFKLLDHIRWGMEYTSSKDAMHFELHPTTDFVPLTGKPRRRALDVLPRELLAAGDGAAPAIAPTVTRPTEPAAAPERRPRGPVSKDTVKDEPSTFEGGLVAILPRWTVVRVAGDRHAIAHDLNRAYQWGQLLFGAGSFAIYEGPLGSSEPAYHVLPVTPRVSKADLKVGATASLDGLPQDYYVGLFYWPLELRDPEGRSYRFRAIGAVEDDWAIFPREPAIVARGFTDEFVAGTERRQTVPPEIAAKLVFRRIRDLVKRGELEPASDELERLDHHAFALLGPKERASYLKILVDDFTTEPKEAAVVEIVRSSAGPKALRDTWNALPDEVRSEVVDDLESHLWGLLVEAGRKSQQKVDLAFVLDACLQAFGNEFTDKLAAAFEVRGPDAPPIVREDALGEVEAAASTLLQTGLAAVEGIWMMLSRPDKVVEGLGQLMKLAAYVQLAALGWKPARQYLEAVLKELGKVPGTALDALKGAVFLGILPEVQSKLRWMVVWELASWLIGVGEVKAGAKLAVELADKAVLLARVLPKIRAVAGVGELAALAAKVERTAALLAQANKALGKTDDAVRLLSHLPDEDVGRLARGLQGVGEARLAAMRGVDELAGASEELGRAVASVSKRLAALRALEQKAGRLTPATVKAFRRLGGHRRFDDDDLVRLARILPAENLDLAMRAVLALPDAAFRPGKYERRTGFFFNLASYPKGATFLLEEGSDAFGALLAKSEYSFDRLDLNLDALARVAEKAPAGRREAEYADLARRIAQKDEAAFAALDQARAAIRRERGGLPSLDGAKVAEEFEKIRKRLGSERVPIGEVRALAKGYGGETRGRIFELWLTNDVFKGKQQRASLRLTTRLPDGSEEIVTRTSDFVEDIGGKLTVWDGKCYEKGSRIDVDQLEDYWELKEAASVDAVLGGTPIKRKIERVGYIFSDRAGSQAHRELLANYGVEAWFIDDADELQLLF